MRLFIATVTMLMMASSSATASPDSGAFSSVIKTSPAERPFTGTVLVMKGGRVLFQEAYGLANREARLPNTTNSLFQIGSVSKWVTVVAALKLVDDGKLSLDAPVTRYLPWYPRATGDRITVGDVFSNMSGLQDHLPTSLINEPKVAASPMTAAEATLTYATGPLVSDPGTAFDYAHTNWVLAQAVVEAAAGKPLEDLLRRSIFEPLQMRGTGVTHGSFARVPNGAIAYASDAAGASRELHVIPEFLIPTGTIYSSAADLARMAHGVYETRMLSASSLKALTSIRFAPEGYALGGRVRHERLGGLPKTVAFEIGSFGGFKALLVHVIGDDVTVVLLNNTNMSEDDLGGLSEHLLSAVYRGGRRK